MTRSRAITWEGFHNARDLGGLPTRDGRRTRFGAAIRSADLRFVTPRGWRAAYEAGVRTIVDLRNHDEIRPDAGHRRTELAGSAQFIAAEAGSLAPPGMERVEAPLDGIEDVGFWQHLNAEGLNGTPLYYRPFLDGKADRCAAVITAIALARPGGVLFHCSAGRDRTGLVALLLLSMVDVEPETVADDYELTAEPLKALYTAMGREDEGPGLAQALAAGHDCARRPSRHPRWLRLARVSARRRGQAGGSGGGGTPSREVTALGSGIFRPAGAHGGTSPRGGRTRAPRSPTPPSSRPTGRRATPVPAWSADLTEMAPLARCDQAQDPLGR